MQTSAAPALTFAPVEVTKEPIAPYIEQQARGGKATGTSGLIEIALKDGDRVRIEGCADPGLVVRIVSALRDA